MRLSVMTVFFFTLFQPQNKQINSQITQNRFTQREQ